MNLGGPAILLANLLEGDRESSIRHFLISGTVEKNEIDYLGLTGRIPERYIYIDSLRRSLNPKHEFLAFLEIRKALKRLNPSIIHTHTSKAGLLGRLAAATLPKRPKIVHTFHGHILYGYFSKPSTAFFTRVERFLTRITDVLIAINDSVKRDLISAGVGVKSEWRTIPIGVKIPLDFKVRSLTELSRESEIRLIWVGRFSPIKNPILALKAFQAAKNAGHRVSLTMVGDGEEMNACRKFADEFNLPVDFQGWQKDTEIYYKSSDLFLLTSFNEGQGMVILEAAVHGVPTLSMRVGGVSDFIENENTGYLSLPDESEYLKTFLEVLNAAKNIRLIGKNAQDLVRSKYSAEFVAQSHAELYTEMVK